MFVFWGRENKSMKPAKHSAQMRSDESSARPEPHFFVRQYNPHQRRGGSIKLCYFFAAAAAAFAAALSAIALLSASFFCCGVMSERSPGFGAAGTAALCGIVV